MFNSIKIFFIMSKVWYTVLQALIAALTAIATLFAVE